MAEKIKIQYINLYTDGSAARRLELPRVPQVQPDPVPGNKPRPKARRVVRVDPLALVSIVVCAVILVLLASGVLQLYTLHTQQQALKDYVISLSEQNVALEQEYREGYDLDRIKTEALALGMIPVEQAQQITVSVTRPMEVTPEPDLWTQIQDFFAGLFA